MYYSLCREQQKAHPVWWQMFWWWGFFTLDTPSLSFSAKHAFLTAYTVRSDSRGSAVRSLALLLAQSPYWVWWRQQRGTPPCTMLSDLLFPPHRQPWRERALTSAPPWGGSPYHIFFLCSTTPPLLFPVFLFPIFETSSNINCRGANNYERSALLFLIKCR